MGKKDSEMAGVKIEKDKQRVVFDVPVKILTDVTLRALLNELGKKTKLVGRFRVAFSNVSPLESITDSGYGTPLHFADFDESKQVFIFDKPIEKLTIDALIQLITHLPRSAGILYGNLSTLTLRDNLGRIVGKLYILPNGKLADDSWLKTRD